MSSGQSLAVPQSARQTLERVAPSLGISLTAVQIDALLAYLELIQKWNKVYNLTAVRDPAEMLTHHLLDSLAVVAPLRLRLAGAEEKPEVKFAGVKPPRNPPA